MHFSLFSRSFVIRLATGFVAAWAAVAPSAAHAYQRTDQGVTSHVQINQYGTFSDVLVSYDPTSRRLTAYYTLTLGPYGGGVGVFTTPGFMGGKTGTLFNLTTASASGSYDFDITTDQWLMLYARTISSAGEAIDQVGYFHCVPPPPVSGIGTAGKLAGTNRNRLNGIGGTIQIATGAESATRTLVRLHGARDVSFTLSYNSLLADVQAAPGPLGYGWCHNFEASVQPSGANLIVHWDGTRTNTFAPDQNGVYRSAEDAAQYDSITAISSGGWRLVRRDQSSLFFNSAGQLVEDRDPHGRSVLLVYTGGNLSSVTEPVSNASLTLAYNANGQVSTITDPTGGTVVLSYVDAYLTGTDTGKVLATITNQNGKVTTFNWGSSGGRTRDIWTLADHVGHVLNANTYDSSHRVVSQVTPSGTYRFSFQEYIADPAAVCATVTVTDRTGAASSYSYDGNYNLLSCTDALSHTSTYAYDAKNRMTSASDPLGHVTSYTYDAAGNVLTITDPANKVTTFSYDSRNNLLTATDPLSGSTARTYDANNNLLTYTDELGKTTTWTYDTNSLPITMTLPAGGVYQYQYSAGRLTQVTDPNGVIIRYGYDANGRVTYEEDSLAHRTSYVYDAVGNVLTATDALGHVSTFAYDHRNRTTSVTNAANAAVQLVYDDNGNLTGTTDPAGKQSSTTYDAENRIVTRKDPLNRLVSFGYDAVGHLISVTDPSGQATTFQYDAADRRVAAIDATGRRRDYSYDARGLLLTATDPLSRVASFGYDDGGRLLRSSNPLNQTTLFTYDARGRVTGAADPASLIGSQAYDDDGNRVGLSNPAAAETSFTYDAGGRLTAMTTPAQHHHTFGYDVRGFLHSSTFPSGHGVTIEYDAAGRISSTTDGIGTDTLTRDAVGRVLSIAEGGKTISYAYDLSGRLTAYTDGDGNTLGYAYDDAGQLTTLTYPDGKTVQYTYDLCGRLSTVVDWAGRTTSYSYDTLGRLTQTLRPNATKQTREYDAGSQLLRLKELAADGVTLIYSGEFGYDAAGHISTELLSPELLPVVAAVAQTFDVDNRLLTHNGEAVTLDADGNLTAIGGGVTPTAYTYDARNRLSAAGSLTYAYNAENRRVAVADSSGTTRYAVNPNAALDQVLVRTAADGTKTFYVYGLGLLHEQTGSTVRYYHADRRGDIIALSDSTGAVLGRVGYGVFGEIVARSGATDTPFLFNGFYGVQTDANGLYYLRARYYHPDLRRFLNQDMVLGGIAAPLTLNRFAYVSGNPVSLIDPFGLFQQDSAPNSSGQKIRYFEIGGMTYAYDPKTDKETLVGEKGTRDGTLEVASLIVVPPVVKSTVGAAFGWIGAKVSGMAGRVAELTAPKITLGEGDAVLAVIKDGKIIAKTGDVLMSHAEFVRRELGTLPQGAEVVTIGKVEGQVTAITSKTFHNAQVPASAAAQAAAKGEFR